MNQPTDTRIDVDQLMQRVRDEARRRRDAAGTDTRPNLYIDAPDEPARASPRANRVQVKDAYTLAELLAHQDEDFLRNAYIGLLRRAPDPGGYEHYLAALRSGAISRVDVLARLRYSPEGRGKRVHVAGLRPAMVYRQLRRVPVLGYLAAWSNHLLRLPRLAQSEVHTRSALDAIESRLDGIEQRLALLASRVEQAHSLAEEASNLSVVAAELSEIAVAGSDRGVPGVDARL